MPQSLRELRVIDEQVQAAEAEYNNAPLAVQSVTVTQVLPQPDARVVKVRRLPERPVVVDSNPAAADTFKRPTSMPPKRTFSTAYAQQAAEQAPVPTRPQLVRPPKNHVVPPIYQVRAAENVHGNKQPRVTPPLVKMVHLAPPAIEAVQFSVVSEPSVDNPTPENPEVALPQPIAPEAEAQPTELESLPGPEPAAIIIPISEAHTTVNGSYAMEQVERSEQATQIQQLLEVLPEEFQQALAELFEADAVSETPAEVLAEVEGLVTTLALHVHLLHEATDPGVIFELESYIVQIYSQLAEQLSVELTPVLVEKLITVSKTQIHTQRAHDIVREVADTMTQDASYTLPERIWQLFNHLAGIAVRSF